MPPAERGAGLPAEPAAESERPVQIVVAARPSGGGGDGGGGRRTKRVGVLILIILVLTFGTTTVVLALKVSTLGNHALVAATPPVTVTGTPAPPPSSPSPTPSSAAGLVGSSPTPAVAASPSATPSGAAGVAAPAPGDPSTTADLGGGVTMRIANFQPGTLISFEIYNRGSDPFVLDFETTDVTVYDDESPARFYTVGGASANHITIQPSATPFNGTSISVNGAPNAAARRWTVTFKAISGRQNVSLQYALA